MKLATLRLGGGGSAAVIIRDDTAVEIPGFADVGELLRREDWRALAVGASGASHEVSSLDGKRWAPLIPRPDKIVCVGLNYAKHIAEAGREVPEYPTLFAKYPEALIGAHDDVELSPLSGMADWEGELAVVVGKTARRVSEEEAGGFIAGYAIINDVTMRDYQYRTLQWLQGKTFENSAPFGPFMVTEDEFTLGATLTTSVDGEVRQQATTDDLIFDPAVLISYLSQILTLNRGDVIATGTPGGIGNAENPPRFLKHGSTLETTIEGLGSQKNFVRGADAAPV